MTELSLPRIEPPVESTQVVRLRARSRIRQVGRVMYAMLALAGLRGAMLCVWPGEDTLREMLVSRWYRQGVPAQRGDILDRAGNRLATTVPSPDIVLDPQVIDDQVARGRYTVERAAGELAKLLGRSDPAPIIRQMRAGKNVRYQLVASAVDGPTALAVAAMPYRGISVQWVGRRYYPEQSVGGQLLGYVSRDGLAMEGLEREFDAELKGESLYLLRKKRGDDPRAAEVSRGMDVSLTIDRNIQRMAERSLEELYGEFSPNWASAVVVDVRSGELLAVANVPTFNPNAPGQVRDEARRNYAMEQRVEPGSVIKPFVVAAALEEGAFTPDDLVDCSVLPAFPQIHDFSPHGTLTVSEVISKSSNIGAATIALKLGGDKVGPYLRAFGFGEALGLRVPLITDGELDNPSELRGIRLANNAFGQGMSASPVQLAYALAALGNGGVRMRPQLISRVTDLHGVPEFLRNPVPVERVVSARTAAQVLAMMEEATQDGGTAVNARVPGYRVAGKTGTAQKATGPDGYGDEYVVSFMGLVPADAPVLAIVITVDAPSTLPSPTGGTVAAPAFVRIAAEALPYLGVIADVPGADLVAEVASGADAPIQIAWSGDGWAIPDLRGRPLRSVLRALAPTGLVVHAAGSGLLASQTPSPGAVAAPGEEVRLQFQ